MASISFIAKPITERDAKFQVFISYSFLDVDVSRKSPQNPTFFRCANQWFSEIQHNRLWKGSNFAPWKTIIVTLCGSFYQENQFQGCQFIHFDCVSPQKCSLLQFAGRKWLCVVIFSTLWFWYSWQNMAYCSFMNCPWHVVSGYCIVWNILALFRETQSCKLGKIVTNKWQHAFWQLSLKCHISRTIIHRLLWLAISCIAEPIIERDAKFQISICHSFSDMNVLRDSPSNSLLFPWCKSMIFWNSAQHAFKSKQFCCLKNS